MRVKFELLNKREESIGSADVTTSFGDVSAIKSALRSVGHYYTECRWISYTIWDDFHADSLTRGRMFIEPWGKDS